MWVLPFADDGDPSGPGELGAYLGALMEVLLSHATRLEIVDREYLHQVLTEHELTLGLPPAEGQGIDLGRLLGATVMISGSYRDLGDVLLVSAHAHDVASARLLGSATATGDPNYPAGVIARVHAVLLDDLEAALPELRSEEADPSPLANLAFLEGLSFYYAARYEQALARFIEASHETRLEPLARLWMANCYLAEARYEHAYLELRRLQIASSLPPERLRSKLDECREHLAEADRRRLDGLVGPGSVDAIRIAVEAIPDPAPTGWTASDAGLHYFGDRGVELRLRISADADGPAQVRARLYQVAGTLVVPHGEPIDVASSVALVGGRPVGARLPISLPRVERETSFEVVFSARRSVADPWEEAGRSGIRVYSASLIDPLKAWSESTRLRVLDETGILRRFLSAHDVAFAATRETRRPAGDRPVVFIIVSDERPRRPLPPLTVTGDAIVLLRESAGDLPKVTVRPHGEGRLVVVEMAIIEALERDPRAQKALVEILRMTLPTTVHEVHTPEVDTP